jgi:hypothetical protein
MPLLEPLTYSNGGPIIMLQVENEYGYYGSDHNYLNNLQDVMEVTYTGMVGLTLGIQPIKQLA